jgi:hypothetical protein
MHRVSLRPQLGARLGRDEDESGSRMKGPDDSRQVPPARNEAMGGRKLEIDDGEPDATVLHPLDSLPGTGCRVDPVPAAPE